VYTITPKIRFFTTTIITLTLFCSEPVFCVPPPNSGISSFAIMMKQLRKKLEVVQGFNLEEQTSETSMVQVSGLNQELLGSFDAQLIQKPIELQLIQKPVLSKTQVSWMDIAPQPKSTHELLQFDNTKPSLSMFDAQELSQFTMPQYFSPQAASTDAVFLKLIQPFLIR